MITQKQFKAYEDIRLSGITNMFDTPLVSELTGLSIQQIREIMQNYTELKAKYYPGTNQGLFDQWKSYIGVKNHDNEPITEKDLHNWADNPKREYQCVFCGNIYTIGQLLNEICCPRCREYKSIMPYIFNRFKRYV